MRSVSRRFRWKNFSLSDFVDISRSQIARPFSEKAPNFPAWVQEINFCGRPPSVFSKGCIKGAQSSSDISRSPYLGKVFLHRHTFHIPARNTFLSVTARNVCFRYKHDSSYKSLVDSIFGWDPSNTIIQVCFKLLPICYLEISFRSRKDLIIGIWMNISNIMGQYWLFRKSERTFLDACWFDVANVKSR